MAKPKSKPKPPPKLSARKQKRLSEKQEIELLDSWLEFGKPDSGSNPLSVKSLPSDAPIGRLPDQTFSPYVGCKKFNQLPLSQKTKDALADSKFKITTDIQRASLPHSLCGRDILGAAKTGSGKTLAFVIPVLEKLYRAKWTTQDGVGSIIMTPTRELADQNFEVLNKVGKYHGFSAGLLIGGRKDIDFEKEHVNNLNIIVCTPGRLLQHMDETENFDCSQLQILVLDEADRILDVGFKVAVNAIVSQLPRNRQTLLFSATQTKSVQDLARLSLKDPEYISVHEESVTATPRMLQQTAMIVPLDQKLDMLWSFIKAHLNSRMLVFLSTCKQVKYVFQIFKKMKPGIPLKCLHGRMKQEQRMAIYSQFCESLSVLFSTDVGSRGLDFNKAVDWVVQVDCPDDVASYIHRVGRTARYHSGGRSVLFLLPSEEKMIEKLQSAKVPIRVIQANRKKLIPIQDTVASLVAKYSGGKIPLPPLAQRAFITYLRSIHKQKDKEVFDVQKLPIEEFSASLGLPLTPNVRFVKRKDRVNKLQVQVPQHEKSLKTDVAKTPRKIIGSEKIEAEEETTENELLLTKEAQIDGRQKTGSKEFEVDEKGLENELLLPKEVQTNGGINGAEEEISVPATRLLKKKKLKINVHRPIGTRMVFDDEGNTLPPLKKLSDTRSGNDLLELDEVKERYKKLKEEMKQKDKEDKLLLRQRLREKRTKKKRKLKRGKTGKESDEEIVDDSSASDSEEAGKRATKRSKIYFDSDNEDTANGKDDKSGLKADSISLAEQEALALKLLGSMHS